MSDSLLLEVQGLKKYFPILRGLLRRPVGYIHAVEEVSFSLLRGETLGLVGESGCGKTTVGRCILRLIEPTAGKIFFYHDGQPVDLLSLTPKALKRLRPRLGIIFQDPLSSLNPRMTVGEIVGEALMIHKVCKGKEMEDRVAELLEAVGLRGQDMRRYPHAFSGGQRQRIGIARALAMRPDLIVADEPVSALDVSVRAQILNLLAQLKEQFSLSYLFISHDLSVVEHISDRVAVMYLGRIVEIAPTERIFQKPCHPYTEALLSAVPIPDPKVQHRKERIRLQGDVPNPSAPPSGCPFHPRCRYAQPICSQKVPLLEEVEPGHQVACHLVRELSLQGLAREGNDAKEKTP